MAGDSFSPWAQEWMTDAACANTDPDEWFPEIGGSSVVAKRICSGCPVLAQCLEHALRARERHGIWGGMTARERDKVTWSPGDLWLV